MQNLLAKLEPLCHQDRMRLMVEYGKNPDEAVLLAFDAGNVYQRRLALASCFSSKNVARVLRGLQDASEFVRGLAVSLAPVVLSAEDVLGVLDLLPAKLRLVLLYTFERRGTVTAIADAYLEQLLRAGNTRDATAIIGFASAEVVKKHLDLMELAASFEWSRLARNHAGLFADWLEEKANQASELNPRLVWQVNQVLPQLAFFSATRVLQLLRAIRRSTALSNLRLQPLLSICPQEIAIFQLESEEVMQLDYSSVAHRLSLQQVLGLQAQQAKTLTNLEDFLQRFSASARVPIFAAFRGSWADAQGFIAASTLRLLPQEIREQEAKRHLEHPNLSTRPLERVQYAGLLGWDEAKPLLEPILKYPKPEYRVAAVPNQIRTAQFDQTKYDAVLEFARFRKNEQDPVCLVMLNAIADLPPAAWQSSQLESLGLVLQDAINAADLSHSTAAAAERIVIRLLPFHALWAAQWIGTLVKERGSINMYGIGQIISDNQAQVIAKALLPVLKAWQSRERDHHIINVFMQLGKRLRVLPDFLELAENLVRTAQAGTAQTALWLLAKHDHTRFHRLVPELLQKDQSWAVVAMVYQHLHLHRQDLLTPFLGRQAYKGKFSTGKTRFVLPISQGFFRWQPQQQSTFVQTLDEVARDSDRDIPAILQVLVQLASIPNAAASTIERLADVKNSRLAIRDAALRALGRLDEQRGLEPLLSALEDDRARVAIYALRRLFLKMMPAKAFAFLQAMKYERVTVAKEVLRLVGELRSQTALTFLLEMYPKNLHRDVRVALLRGLWDYPENTITWQIFQEAAQNPDAAIADGVIRIPVERLSEDAQQKLIGLLAQLFQHPDPDVRLQTLHRCQSLPVKDTQKQLVQPLLAALNSSTLDQTIAATRAFFATYGSEDPSLIESVFGQLLPQRKILQQAVRSFIEMRPYLLPRHSQQCASAILRALEPDVLTLQLQTEVVLMCFEWQAAAQWFIQKAAEIHAGIYHTALESLQIAQQQRSQAQLGLQTLELAWRNHTHDILRRLALEALVLSASNEYQNNAMWTTEQIALLELYRKDPASLVAGAAQFTFPVLETN